MKRYRLLGISITDLLIGMVAMIIVFLLAHHFHFKEMKIWPFIVAAILLTIPVGIVFHIIFGVNTQINYVLKLSQKPKLS
jgi:hypothetical protein